MMALYSTNLSKNILLLLSLLSLASQANPKAACFQNKQEQQVLRHEVQVTLKLIQVYVTDDHGKPVMDLEKSDFVLLDDNKPQPITEFETHVIPSSSGKIEPQSTPLFPASGIAETMNRKFFLLFDFAFTNLAGIDMAKKAALHFIDTQVIPTDEVGVMSYSTTKGLFLYEYLTTDRGNIREVISQIGAKEILGRAGQLLEDIKSIKHASGNRPSFSKALSAFEEWGNLQYEFEATDFYLALKNFSKALRYIPGYKYIVFFSLGIPPSYLRVDRPLRELEASNSPVLAVNVAGMDSRFKELEFMTGHTPEFIDRTQRRDSSLREMARVSGGKYFGGTNDYKKIAENIQSLTRSYYVLGYKIDEKWDGRYHGIKVNVQRPGYDVHFQKGYFNPKPFAQYSSLEKELHLIDLALAERPYLGDPVRFPLRALSSPMKRRSNVTLIAEIPAEIIQDVSKEKLEIFTLVFDEKQNIVSQQRTDVEPSSLLQDRIYFYSILSLPPGNYESRVVMRNRKTGRGAVASSSIIVLKRFEDGLKLYSPLLLVPGGKGAYLNGSPTEKGQDKPYSIPDFYPFNSEEYRPLVHALSQDTSRLLILLPSSIIGFDKSNMSLSVHLVDLASGERRVLPLSVLGQQQEGEDVIVYSLELRTENLTPGKYSLYFFADDIVTRQPFTYVACPLEIK